MPYFDVLFPLNIGPLTYECPEELVRSLKPGMVVSAPIRNKLAKGIILSENPFPSLGKMKELAGIYGTSPVLGAGMLSLLRWMSDYYLAPEGAVLKQTVPEEIFSKTKRGKARKTDRTAGHVCFDEVRDDDIACLLEASHSGNYATFLLHSPSWIYEYSFVAALIRKGLKNVLVILPEIAQAELLYALLSAVFIERTCLLHNGVAKGRRSEYIEGIIAGKYDIVVGTRSALFAPLKNISLIFVLHEHSSSYKLEEGIRYHMRDVAVMRGFFEKTPVLLSSVTPSIDSYFNAISKKYSLIRPGTAAAGPRIKIIDMRFEKPVRPNISKEVVAASREKIRADGEMIFVVNRRGYSTLLLCRECGRAVNCRHCAIPMVLHRSEAVLKCHYCGAARSLPDGCDRCGSHHLDLLGSGTQRVQENIEDLFGVETIRFDSDSLKRDSEIEEVMKAIDAGPARIVIGTKMMTKRLGRTRKFSAAAVLSADSSLNLPDFRASEKTYRELYSIIELVEPAGMVLIQTRFPQNSLFRHLRKRDYLSFVMEELPARKELGYPPYSKLLAIRCSGEKIAEAIAQNIAAMKRGIDVLGPVATRGRKGGDFSILLKSSDRKALREATKEALGKFAKSRRGKTGGIVIDVDPA
jgi:primosomal protein N' (replication factor Y) (superfamily II helicase)